MGIIQRTTLFGYFDDAKEIQICIQDQSMMTILKIIWEEALFILGGYRNHGRPRSKFLWPPLNGPNREVFFWIIPIILVKMWGFDPPGSPYMVLPPTVMQLILNKYHHAFSWMYICGYFALSNGPNREVLWIIPIFVVIFDQNVGFWPPGVSMYGITPCCYAINFEEMHHALS